MLDDSSKTQLNFFPYLEISLDCDKWWNLTVRIWYQTNISRNADVAQW